MVILVTLQRAWSTNVGYSLAFLLKLERKRFRIKLLPDGLARLLIERSAISFPRGTSAPGRGPVGSGGEGTLSTSGARLREVL